MLHHLLPLHHLQREFPQCAAILIRELEQVASCNIAKRALGYASWDESIIVRSRQLLEPESLWREQVGQDYFESIGGLEAVRSVIVDTGFFHPFLTTF